MRSSVRGSLAFVPTMGALHAGHLALIAEAKRRAGTVAASIFVNPAQFNDKDDLAHYPRHEAEDARKLAEAGCELLWAPAVEDIYPEGFSTSVHVSGLSDRWEGEHRPGHFDGVATVVSKLFVAMRPDVAIFGEKDFQQLAVIRRMTNDLGLPVTVVAIPTVREGDGLAMSSRNALLTPSDRERAPTLFKILCNLSNAISKNASIDRELESASEKLEENGFDPIDYLSYVDGETLEPLDRYRKGGRLIAAAFLGRVRLIDNVEV